VQRQEMRIRCQRFRDRGQETKGGRHEDSNDETKSERQDEEKGD
jgi:hypothetical protein